MTDQATGTQTIRDEADVNQLFEAIRDPDSRAIIRETRSEALTAKELSERCDIATSTAYRKIERLVDVGILTEHVRFTSKTRHAHEYTHDIDSIELDVTNTGVSVVISEDVAEQTDLRLSAD
ncbi:helix-turn-helix domain-containing protein [Halovenus halobia]|uniref:helix-turn-helix domain-containing protein n=1 Tax=Halovenus halobia TaxID=3396622 RepID=UPI003F558DAC